MLYRGNRIQGLGNCFCFIGLLVMLYAFSSCNGTTNKIHQREQGIDAIQVERNQDSIGAKIGSDPVHIVPGISIGYFHLKEDIENSKLFERLGKPDSGDAAMCKSWAMWYWKDSIRKTSNEFDVYTSCDPDLDMRKSIRILRLSGVKFITDLGVSESSTRTNIQEMFPTIASVGEFLTPDGKSVFLMDDLEKGIAFEFNSSDSAVHVSAAVVHQPGTRLTDSYLPFYTKK